MATPSWLPSVPRLSRTTSDNTSPGSGSRSGIIAHDPKVGKGAGLAGLEDAPDTGLIMLKIGM